MVPQRVFHRGRMLEAWSALEGRERVGGAWTGTPR